MKVLLIFAHYGPKHSILQRFLLPSMTLKQLAAVIPSKHEVELLDERYQTVDLNWDGDLIGISCFTYSANHAYYIADEFRKRGKKVILGGYHPSALPEEAKQHADSVVIGEGEISLPKLLKDVEQGTIKPFYQSPLVNPEKIPSAKLVGKDLTFMAAVQATRGCPFQCKFCSIHNIEGPHFRPRPIKDVIEEIRNIPQKKIFFVDSSLTINPHYTKELFREMKDLNRIIDCSGNVNVLAKDEKLLNLARDAGVKRWHVGFESLSQITINNAGKKSNIIIEYEKAVKKVRDYGMTIIGLFMFGFDTDTNNVFDNTLNTISEWNLDHVRFSIVTPYPGTKLYEKLDTEGRILTRNWSLYDSDHVVIRPVHMTPQELYDGTWDTIKRFYSLSQIIRGNVLSKNLSVQDFLIKGWENIFTMLFYRTVKKYEGSLCY